MTTSTTTFTDTLNQANETFFNAVTSGLKVQEDVIQRYASLFDQFGKTAKEKVMGVKSVEQNATKVNAMTRKSLETWEENANRCLSLVNESNQLTEGGITKEGQAKAKKLWEQSFKTLKTNLDTTVNLNQELLKNYMELVALDSSTDSKAKASK
ncbi:MAG: hypothetical protein HOH33_04810 [Verrucomicrobia bacterium]|jgi:hypothetical protein|nr:hypothetical protein [Verrucomicrobiota bacterium]